LRAVQFAGNVSENRPGMAGRDRAIRAGAANCVFTGVPPGTYAMAFFHAEHNETQLTTGMFGKQLQG